MEHLFSLSRSKLLPRVLCKEGLGTRTFAGTCLAKPQPPALASGAARPCAGVRAHLAAPGSMLGFPRGVFRLLSGPSVSRRSLSDSRFNIPPSAESVARPVGVCSMLKLPVQTSAEGLDAAFVGVPLDTGTSNRPGAR